MMNDGSWRCEATDSNGERCNNIKKTRTYCQTHYDRLRRRGSLNYEHLCIECGNKYINKTRGSRGRCESCLRIFKCSFPPTHSGFMRSLLINNLTILNYIEIYKSQKGRCYICSYYPGKPKSWAKKAGLTIDHDHKCCSYKSWQTKGTCGRCIRGLLCHSCNIMVGCYENNKGSIQIEIFDKYLIKPYFIFSTPLKNEIFPNVKSLMNTRKDRNEAHNGNS